MPECPDAILVVIFEVSKDQTLFSSTADMYHEMKILHFQVHGTFTILGDKIWLNLPRSALFVSGGTGNVPLYFSLIATVAPEFRTQLVGNYYQHFHIFSTINYWMLSGSNYLI